MSIIRIHRTPRMSKIVEHNDIIYLSGQIAKNETDNIKEQTKTTLEKIENLLIKAGSDKKNMLSATIYLRNVKDFCDMNEVWDNWIEEGHEPVRTCVAAHLARPNLLVEISVISVKKRIQKAYN